MVASLPVSRFPDLHFSASAPSLATTIAAIAPADDAWRARARRHLSNLTMPPWAMGRVMDLALDVAGMTRSLNPPLDRRAVVIMAADHGVTAEGVSPYPSEVTAQMVRNFVAGGAGINAVAGVADARVFIVDMGVAGDLSDLAETPAKCAFSTNPCGDEPNSGESPATRVSSVQLCGQANQYGNSGRILSCPVAKGTANLARTAAMSREQALTSIENGIMIAKRLANEIDLFGLGEMGIGNTTPSSAITAVLCGTAPEHVTGRGTGLDDPGLQRKIGVVRDALKLHSPDPADPVGVLASVGGFEIGGLAGFILGAAASRKPVLLDGFITTAAALLAYALAPACRDYMIAAHRSVEPGHIIALEKLNLRPLLDLGLRLGEGTGAALAMPLVMASAAVLTQVATFAEAGVSGAGTHIA
ncbi:MAG: nicotinate-nucleotide--dimethylbenzimidazole phosphoribosyltransferase [Candidatus Ozemobacteraceae bacterium]